MSINMFYFKKEIILIYELENFGGAFFLSISKNIKRKLILVLQILKRVGLTCKGYFKICPHKKRFVTIDEHQKYEPI